MKLQNVFYIKMGKNQGWNSNKSILKYIFDNLHLLPSQVHSQTKTKYIYTAQIQIFRNQDPMEYLDSYFTHNLGLFPLTLFAREGGS